MCLCLSVAAATQAAPSAQGGPLVTVELQYCGSHPEKPPLEKLLFRASLRNTSRDQQWVLLPTTLYAAPTRARANAGVWRIEVLADDSHKVKLLRFDGTVHVFPYLSNAGGGFQAILLGPKSHAVLPLQIDIWSRTNGPVLITVSTATQLQIEGRPILRLFRMPLAVSSVVTKHLSAVDSWQSKDRSEVSLHVEKTSDFGITDALASKCDSNVH